MDNKMDSSNICFNYALGTILYETCLVGILYLCNISPTASSQVMLFLKLFTPALLVASYLFLRLLCRAERKKKKDNFSEGMLLLFSICSVLVGSVVCHIIAVLLGAPLIENIDETFAFSVLCSALSFFPLYVAHEGRWDDFLNYLPESMCVCEKLQDSVKMVSVFSIVGAWAGAFPIPLDWDRDWQTWPITCCVGLLLGHFVGLFFVILSCVSPLSSSDSNWKNKIT